MAIFEYPRKPVSRPHVQVSVDDSALGGAINGSLKPLALIGKASGGDPSQVYKFTSYTQAKRILRSGNLLDAMELAWNPSPNQVGAGAIYAVRVGTATQSTATDGAGALTFTSKLFGIAANGITATLIDSAIPSAKKLTVSMGSTYNQVYDNLGNIFTVKYTGADAYAALTITHDVNGLATTFEIKTGADSGTATTDVSFDLGTGLISDLVANISNREDYTASFVAYGNKDMATQYLDAVADQTIKSVDLVVTAVGQDIVNQLQWDDYVSVVYDPTKTIPSTAGAGITYSLSGATEADPTGSWSEWISLLANEDVYYAVPLTSDASVHAEITQFVTDQNENGHSMRAIVGGGVKETINQLMARQAAIRNQRTSLVGTSGTYTFSDGRIASLPGYMIAAEIGGLRSGLGVAEPITFKYLKLTSLDTYYTSDQLDTLNENGILAIEYVRNRSTTGFRIVSDVTTFNDQTEPVMNNAATGELTDFLMSDLRYVLENEFIGTKLHLNSASLLKNRVQSFLDQAKLDPNSMVVDYVPDDVKVIINGNQAAISFVVQPAVGLDLIEVSGTYQPFTSSSDNTTTA